MLARGAAAEVLAGKQDAAVRVRLRLRTKSGLGLSVGVVTPVVEQERAVAGALDALQKLLGNNLIGVDVGAVSGMTWPR